LPEGKKIAIPDELKLSNTRPFLHGYVEFKQLEDGVLIIICPICKKPITKFFVVSKDEWNAVAGDFKDCVICKKCYDDLKSEKYPEKCLI